MLLIVSAKENFKLQTKGLGPKPEYYNKHTFKEESLKKDFLSKMEK